MLFNSLIFIVFAIIFYIVFKIIGKNIKGRLFWITAASFFFYGWWDWRFLSLILISGLIDFIAALGIVRFPKQKKLLLILSVAGNIGSLALFKYSGFVAENIDKLLGLQGSFSLAANIPEFFLITPVGISFYTFQSMSYTFDVYRNKLNPTRSFFQFFAYLSMFPQLVAGPIVRAETILPQLLKITPVTGERKWEGFRLVVSGYFKKMVIADNLAPLVVAAFSAPEINSSSLFWWGIILAFAFQIYCDFAGYSDIARGLAIWMGYDFPDNFNHPYISKSVREFWERWHISLSTWFRDYLYIPLGGNKKGKARSYLNLWITMLISGLWHGAAWTFIIWGAVHAFFASVERFTRWPEKIGKSAVAKFVAWLFVTIQVLVAWVFFRAETVGQAWKILKTMFSFQGPLSFGWGLDISIFMSVIILREIVHAFGFDDKLKPRKPVFEMLFYALLVAIIVFFRGEGSQFIYFQF
ncbi:MAG TPA: membrane-bound O-acyltransferase family protein [Prolixibacteraceae bacterium]|nr:membrane-bound O-acyltransferase family protein [Prolixibacteraceae bacterium]